MKPPIIYNLFPRLVGPTTRWVEHADRALEMGFNWLYLNPWHYPGFSGSLYAPKELWRMNPLFQPPGADTHSLEPLVEFLAAMRERDLPVMMDLVIGHTSKDSPLISAHPEWFVRDASGQVQSPFVRDPDDPSRITVWGDLAELDHERSPDRDALWEYWVAITERALGLGFSGFRCDAAYKIPAALWCRLIERAKAQSPDAEFFAETLGAPLEPVIALRDAGFDYFFNSSKWWNLSDPWALEQHATLGRIAPSISFPESHDTARLAEESGGREQVQRQRYALAAAFSAGVMMPIGYEFGFRTPLNVVTTQPSDWERRRWDLRPFITRVNLLKRHHWLLHGEGSLTASWGLHGDLLLLERRVSHGGRGNGWILINKVWDESREASLRAAPLAEAGEGYRLYRVCRDDSLPGGEPLPDQIRLDPAEVVYVLPQRK